MGQPIATMAGGCFSDYVVLPLKFVMPVATMQKEVVALLTSGLTASIGQPCSLAYSGCMSHHIMPAFAAGLSLGQKCCAASVQMVYVAHQGLQLLYSTRLSQS